MIRSVAAAKGWLDENAVILDTETTGLGRDAEIVEIAMIDVTGKVLLNTLVKPVSSIPAEVTAIHGITNEMVKDAPDWVAVHDQVVTLFQDRTVVIYNAQYDLRLIAQMAKRHWLDSERFLDLLWDKPECAMLAYAEFRGDWNDYRENYRWVKLVDAARHEGVEVKGAHRALADCKMTLGVIEAMANFEGDWS